LSASSNVTSGGKEADWMVAALALAGVGYALLRSHFAKWFAARAMMKMTIMIIPACYTTNACLASYII